MGGLAGRVREYVRLNGISYTARRAVEKFRDQYLREYDRLYRRVRATPAELEQQRHRAWKETPLISILVPVYNTNPRMLRNWRIPSWRRPIPTGRRFCWTAPAPSPKRRPCFGRLPGWMGASA